MRPLNKRQKAFVAEYLVDLNATQAATRAGYSDPSFGRQVITKPHVKAAIDAAMAKRSQRTEITADDVIRELARLGLHDVRKLFDSNGRMKAVTDLDDDIAAAVQSIKVVTRQLPRQKDEPVEVEYVHEIKLHDKVKPLELIGKHLGKRLGQWNDRTEHDVAPDSPLAALVAAINGGKHTLQPGDDDA